MLLSKCKHSHACRETISKSRQVKLSQGAWRASDLHASWQNVFQRAVHKALYEHASSMKLGV